jgi:TldD protein
MNIKTFSYLEDNRKIIKDLCHYLKDSFDYISILGTNVEGIRYEITGQEITVAESDWGERGFVIRTQKNGRFNEHSFNDFNPALFEEYKNRILALNTYQQQIEQTFDCSLYNELSEDDWTESFYGEEVQDPLAADPGRIIRRLTKLREKIEGLVPHISNVRIVYEGVDVSKLFVSAKKDLFQSYTWSQGYLVPRVKKNDNSKYTFRSFSGLTGTELIDRMEEQVESVAGEAEALLSAGKAEPGEYDIICSPGIAGIIAHEAFGHGVELDMFIKKRAKAEEFLGRQVASARVDMHDGAAIAGQTGSFFFDDEGNRAGDTIIIRNGILHAGISDQLSALALQQAPTGNGRRESYRSKAYSRMTNTFFAPGNDLFEDMIASISHGYLIETAVSGMEDPKNWGIQLVALIGREIRQGKLTSRIVSPVIMSGYVPDVLTNISMVSADVSFTGSGYCGKGFKERVKVSSGAPYIKTRMKLG